MLTLAIETSAARCGIALGDADLAAFDSLRDLGDGAGRDLGDLLTQGLGALGRRVADIGAIAVNIGPGSLGSLRDGVAFAHGLAYAAGIPVFPFTSFELMGVAAGGSAARPALCTRRANEGLAYAGVFDGARVRIMRHGALAEIVAEVAGDGRAFVTAGSFRAELAALAPGAELFDSGVEAPTAATMLAIGLAGRTATDVLASPVFPLHEGAAVFRD